MTVKELIETGPTFPATKIIVRDHDTGRWLQGYEIGEAVEMRAFEYTIEFQAAPNGKQSVIKKSGKFCREMAPGEIRDVYCRRDVYPLKLIKDNVAHLPDNVAHLEVTGWRVTDIHGKKLHIDAYSEEKECR